MIDRDRDFVLRTYDAIADPALWPDILDRFAERIRARGCIIFEWSGEGPNRRLSAPLFTTDYEPELIRGYINAFHDIEVEDQDVFEAHSLRTDQIDLVEDSVLGDDEAALARPNVRQLLQFGIRYRAAGLLDKDNTSRSRFSVQLAPERGRLDAADQAWMAEVLPHVAKALELSRRSARFSATHHKLLAAMDKLRIGVCILDDGGRVVVENGEFARQRAEYEAFRIDRKGRLHIHSAADGRQFTTLRSDALAHGRFGARPRKEAIATAPRSGMGALCIEVAPLPHFDEVGAKAVGGSVVYALDTTQPTNIDPQPMKSVFGLTDAELELARLLGEGLTNAGIAERRDRSVATVNTQVRSLLAKTRCSNRTQFVRLMTNFGADYLKPDDTT